MSRQHTTIDDLVQLHGALNADESIGRQRAQLLGADVAPRCAGLRGFLQALGFRLGQARLAVPAERRLSNRPVEQPSGKRRREKRHHALTAGGFAEHRDVVRVAPEGGDVLPHPSQRGDLVQRAVVRGRVERLAPTVLQDRAT